MNQLDGFSSLGAAYEGVEAEGSFSDRAGLEAYRASALGKTDLQAEFLEPLLAAGGRLIEVGCGNGRLPISLLQRGAIDGGLGLDLSRTRIDFARAWAAELGLDGRLSFAATDATTYELGVSEYTAAVCITGALGYFDAYAAGSAARLLAQLRGALASGGLLVLELYPHPRARRLLQAGDGHIRTWSELEADDPWRFYLSEIRQESPDVVVHEKTFLHRTEGLIDEGRSERLFLYTAERISAQLLECGYSDVRCLEGWTHEPYAGGEVLVVTASP